MVILLLIQRQEQQSISIQQMDKKKSLKKINKTFNSSSKKQQSTTLPVKDIIKQIGELKKQLVSIKSKKYLQIKKNYQNALQSTPGNINKQSMEAAMSMTKSKIRSGNYDTFNEQGKQNVQRQTCRCSCNCQSIKQYRQQMQQKIGRPIQSNKIELVQICAIRSRQAKLKINIQINKIKSLFQKIYQQTKRSQLAQLAVAEINSTLVYIDCIIKQYESDAASRKKQMRQMRDQLDNLSINAIKLAENHSNQKQTTECQQSEILQLKRHLSYNMQLMKDNKEEAQKCAKQLNNLQMYNKQLQENNALLRRQLRQCNQKRQSLAKKLDQTDLNLQRKIKQLLTFQSDLQLAQLESQKNKQKKRQYQRINQQILQSMRELQQKFNIKQHQLVLAQQQNSQLSEFLEQAKEELKAMQLIKANKQMQLQKMERQQSTFMITLQNKQQTIADQDAQLRKLKQNLFQEIKSNQKLTESLEYCQMEINNLSEQIDELKRTNQRLKNRHFRNKLIQKKSQSEIQEKSPKKSRQATDRKNEQNFEESSSRGDSHHKSRNKILNEIQVIIQKHRKNQQSQQDSQMED